VFILLDSGGELAGMCHSMWPNESLERRGRGRCTPRRQAVAFVAQDHDGSLIGFIEVSLRSHADGCDPSNPVGKRRPPFAGFDPSVSNNLLRG